MKIFWSWQSDTPGKTGRFFVRDALNIAINELKAEGSAVTESERPDVSSPPTEKLHLDHDRKNVRGSPDLFRIIVEKIRLSTVFVADVTPVATVTESKKKVMNPNVAIELGVALECLGSDVLLVLNTAYGGRESMPFDLAHKAGPIMYSLQSDASNSQIESSRKALVGDLKEALKLYLRDAGETAEPIEESLPFHIKDGWESTPTFVTHGQLRLASVGVFENKRKTIQTKTDVSLFLRVYPTQQIPDLSVDELEKLVTHGHVLSPFYFTNVMDWGRDHEGFVVYSVLDSDHPCPDYVKAFVTGEVWAVLHYYQLLHFTGGLPLEMIINLLPPKLRQYRTFLSDKLGYKGKIGYVIGITGLSDTEAVVPGLAGNLTKAGTGFVPIVTLRGTCSAAQTEQEILTPFAKQVWQAFGLPARPVTSVGVA